MQYEGSLLLWRDRFLQHGGLFISFQTKTILTLLLWKGITKGVKRKYLWEVFLVYLDLPFWEWCRCILQSAERSVPPLWSEQSSNSPGTPQSPAGYKQIVRRDTEVTAQVHLVIPLGNGEVCVCRMGSTAAFSEVKVEPGPSTFTCHSSLPCCALSSKFLFFYTITGRCCSA